MKALRRPRESSSGLRAWLDILTPKQVLFFGPVIEELEASGAEVLATSRAYREVAPVAEQAGVELAYVGERGKKGSEEQLLAATRRQEAIIPMVKDFRPHVAVSLASAVCARVAYGLRIRHIAVNDSPHSEVAARLSVPLSYRLLCPWIIPYRAWQPFGIRREQVTTYRALDPAAWLKRDPAPGPVPKLDGSKKTITVRVQESDAPYLAKADAGWIDDVLTALLDAFPDANHVALCRYDYQVEEIRKRYGSSWTVPDEVVSGRGLLAATDLFVGMGGTMTAEAALMGIPAISAFQGSLYTDRYLRSVGLLAKAGSKASLLSHARLLLRDGFRTRLAEKARRILNSMEDPVPQIVRSVQSAVNQA
ncbi:MAG: DUF354 domain-containing protein [Nitrososphaerota archaeon]|nr:DUF354 domain-containing protein [Nitrososphaerota archaeon]